MHRRTILVLIFSISIAALSPGPVVADQSKPYVAHNDAVLLCEVDEATGVGLGSACFDVSGPRTITIEIEDDSGLPVGGYWGFLDDADYFGTFCQSGEVFVPEGQHKLLVFVDGPATSALDCALEAGRFPFGFGTAGEIRITGD